MLTVSLALPLTCFLQALSTIFFPLELMALVRNSEFETAAFAFAKSANIISMFTRLWGWKASIVLCFIWSSRSYRRSSNLLSFL